MPWDRPGAWPSERRWIWLTFAGWLCVFHGPAFIENLRCPPGFVPDFFQEYTSARNCIEGAPVYSSLAKSAPRYLGMALDPKKSYVLVNAHPPASVLLALPFGAPNLLFGLTVRTRLVGCGSSLA
jgi:hypothetical protein